MQEIAKELETNMSQRERSSSNEPITLDLFHLTTVGGVAQVLKARDYKDMQVVFIGGDDGQESDKRCRSCNPED